MLGDHGAGVSNEVPVPTSTPKLPIGTVYEGDLPPPDSHPTSAATPLANQPATEASKMKHEERKLAIMMMSKKRKRLFDQIMKSRNKKRREVSELKRKREQHEEESQVKKVKVS